MTAPATWEDLAFECATARDRIDDLLRNGNRLLQEARDARAAHAKTRLQLDAVTSQYLALLAALRRLDPVYQ